MGSLSIVGVKNFNGILCKQLPSGGCLLYIKFLMRENMQDAVTKSIEITITISISFQHFDFVVTSFGKTICNRRIKRVDNAGKPVFHSLCALLKRL